MISSRLTPNFIMVPCRCGRILRAKWDQVGTEIKCWDCQRMTLVVIPRARLRLFDLIFRSVSDLFNRPGSWWLVVLSGLVALLLSVRYAGLGLASVLLLAGAALYGDVIENPEEINSEYELDWMGILRRLTWGRGLACLLMVAGTVVPLWLIHAGVRRSPHLSVISLPLLLLTWFVVPIIMVGVYSNLGGPGTIWRERLGFLRSYPVITFLVLTIPPLMMIGAEALVAGIIHFREMIPFFALDLMPPPGKPYWFGGGFLYYEGRNFADLPPDRFIRGYLVALRRGYSFVGSIPPSLSIPTKSGLNSYSIRIEPSEYFQFRLFLSFLISLTLVLAFTIQARCLSILAGANRQRHG